MPKSLINSFMYWVMKKRIRQIETFIKYPIDTQNEILFNLLYNAKHTEYGKKYGFNYISNYQKFKEIVPLVTYEEFEPYIERMRSGEKDIVYPGQISKYAKSSGTTNAKSKFIPISEESLENCHYKAGKDMLAVYCHNYPDTQIFGRKNLRLGGSSEIYKENTSVHGDLSAILIDNLPIWAEFLNIPDRKTSLMSNWDEKIPAIINQVKTKDVGCIMGVPSWMMVLLKKIIDETKIETIDELWPNIESFFHGGVSFIPYKEEYKKICAKPLNYLEIYNASEGFFAIQDLVDSDELLLMLDYGIFYEFIPMEEFGFENPKVISLDEVELNKNYALVITTNGGLWRYIIGDTIKFTSLNPHRIKVTGRTKHHINVFGEELMIDNVQEALKKACQMTGSVINEWTGAPIFMTDKTKGGHEWVFEFIEEPQNKDLFNTVFDTTLKEVNSDYEAKRHNNMTLNPPVIHYSPKGLFFEWMRKRGKLGGQNKVPRLSNTREYIEPLLEMIKK